MNNKIGAYTAKNADNKLYYYLLQLSRNENKIVLSTEWIAKNPALDQHLKGNTNILILEFKKDRVILYDKDTQKTVCEYFLSDNKISSFTFNLAGDECENTLEYDEFGSLVKATKAYSDKAFESTFSYVIDEKYEMWHDLATVSNLPNDTAMMVYLLTAQTLG